MGKKNEITLFSSDKHGVNKFTGYIISRPFKNGKRQFLRHGYFGTEYPISKLKTWDKLTPKEKKNYIQLEYEIDVEDINFRIAKDKALEDNRKWWLEGAKEHRDSLLKAVDENKSCCYDVKHDPYTGEKLDYYKSEIGISG